MILIDFAYIFIFFIVLVAGSMFYFSEPLDKNDQSLFDEQVEYYTFDLDWLIAIVFDNIKEIYWV